MEIAQTFRIGKKRKMVISRKETRLYILVGELTVFLADTLIAMISRA